ncbi:hypothetical protein HDR61_03550 [bacterium]|nr:hypothetical protein [bacterium]
MSRDEIQSFLERKFPGEKIKFVGAGTDSTAFRVGNKICRFPHRDADIYKIEADLCNFIRPNISVPIPNVEIVQDGKYIFAVHDMIMGNKWSWHKFSWQRARQDNLARTYAGFLAELHGVNTNELCHRVPGAAGYIPYCDWDEVKDFLSRFMTPAQMKCFWRNYLRITGAPIDKNDIVFIHMGMKGANSVVDNDGNICGVFDFCSGGLYERWRDFVLPYLGRNRALFRQILREYKRLTGAQPDPARIADLAVIEFLWRRRIFPDGKFQPRDDYFIKKNLAVALARFYRVPKPFYWIIYARMSLHQRRMARRAAE